MHRYQATSMIYLIGLTILVQAGCSSADEDEINFLILMSDNHYFEHLGCYGDPVVRTPAIDGLARQGVRFTQAFCASPSCTPARGAMLTGQDIWRLGPGGNLWSSLPAEIPTYTDILEAAGYTVGHDRKGWGPGDFEAGGRSRNPAGYSYADFAEFLEHTDAEPWCYLLSSRNPHRPFNLGAGVASGMNLDRIEVPAYLPDVPAIRSDIADYYESIQQFDQEVATALAHLDQTDQGDRTVIIVCADNGWMMPRGLANLYDFGTRVPLIVHSPKLFAGDRVVTDLVSLNDLAPTILELAGCKVPEGMTAKSLLPILRSSLQGRVNEHRKRMVMGRERHAICRTGGLGYPGRCIRTDSFLLIVNYEPDRWPAGEPPLFGDIDLHMLQNDCPTKEYMMLHKEDINVKPLFEQAFLKRPRMELFDLIKDPDQMQNVATNPTYAATLEKLQRDLYDYLTSTKDPRAIGGEVKWDTYPYYKEKDWVGTPRKAAREKLGLEEEYSYR